MKISTKILAGFSGLVALLAIVSSISNLSLNEIGEGFTKYRKLAQETNQSGRVQANLLLTRLNVKNFIIQATDDSISQVRKRGDATTELLTALNEMVKQEPQKLSVAETAIGELEQYKATFDQVTQLQNQRNQVVHTKLEKLGPQVEKKITATMQSAMNDGDAEAAYKAGMFLRELLLVRLYAMKYLDTNDEAAYQRVIKEFGASLESQQDLMASLENPTRRQYTQEAMDVFKQYAKNFKLVHDIIVKRNDLIVNTLDVIGPRIASNIENLKLDVKTEQETLGSEMLATTQERADTVLTISILAAIAGIIAAFLIGRGISKPVVSMTAAMQALANGNLETDIPGRGRTDEIGNMASAVQVFKTNGIEVKRLEEQNQQAAVQAEEEKRAAMNALANQFEASVGQVLTSVATSAHMVNKSAEDMATAADQASQQSSTVAAAANQATQNLQTVASATEELTASIHEIAQQVNQSANVARSAVEEANDTFSVINGLVDSSHKVGEIIGLITDIAEQTNLLALNATIEAARAGEMGKGFAVVASEVKNLANQTGRATEEIGSQVQGIQTATQRASKAVENIGKTIGEIDEITSAIATAVEEQQASTSEIASNIQQVTTGNQDVTDNITTVNTTATKTGTDAENIVQASNELTQQFDELQTEVDKFLQEIRAA